MMAIFPETHILRGIAVAVRDIRYCEVSASNSRFLHILTSELGIFIQI